MRWLAALAVMLGAARAEAYPHFQLSSGTVACNQCHFAPAGGGLLTGWGRDESADTVSRGGDGRFLHGWVELPRTLQLGGDFRLAGLVNDVGASDGAELAAFPMQVQLNARVGGRGAWSLVASVALRGRVRGSDEQPLSSFFVSPEHYVYWRPRSKGPYARLGRFAIPYGLRLVDHTTYVRRWLGFGLFDEPYALSGGVVRKDWELHATAFVSDPLRGAAREEFGGALLYERHGPRLAWGLSARAGVADSDTRLTAGPFMRWWLPGAKLMLMAEVGAVRQLFNVVDGADRWQLASYAGPVWVPTRGVYAGAAYELFDEELELGDTERHAGSLWVAYHPRAHFEVMLSGRSQLVGADDAAHTALLQVHYYP
ncbi:MAG: hypothetical protein IT370_01365 [Deltaproteobacteria bacterium]|nr:hypothetical protein [Deltaproteobacteria bacterium]